MPKEALLSCYRGLDLTDEKGALCARYLADLGADVIKVERPGGDPSRRFGPFYHDEAHPQKSLSWFAYNLGKRGITLNLETEDGRQIFRQLVAKVNFVVESFPPGYLERLGLGYAGLKAINPAIVLTSITPFGQTGPYRDYAASDLVVTALGGLLSDCGDPDRAPVQVTFPQAYMCATAEAASATMMALYHQAKTGEGQHVDVAAMESMTWAVSEKLPYWSIYGYDRVRAGNQLRFMLMGAKEDIRLPLLWECQDGWVCFAFLGGLPGARNNQKLVELMDRKGMATEHLLAMDWAKFDLLASDPAVIAAQFTKPISAFFAAHTKKELYDMAIEASLSLYPVNDAAAIAGNEQLKHRGFWVDVAHPELGASLTYGGAFASFSETPITIGRRAPLIGEHNLEILEGELGMPRSDLLLLKQANVI